jgi:hypothetical protein
MQGFRDLIDLNERAYIAFPAGTPPGGVAFGNGELQLVAGAMFRQGYVVSIVGGTPAIGQQMPSSPGPEVAPSLQFLELPAKITPLSVAIEEENHARRVTERKGVMRFDCDFKHAETGERRTVTVSLESEEVAEIMFLSLIAAPAVPVDLTVR